MKSSIKLVYVIDGLGMGGAERLMIPLLQNLDRDRFTARVCVLKTHRENPLAEDIRALGVPVDGVNVSGLRDLAALGRLRAYLKGHHANLVHTQLEFADVFGNLAAKTLRLPSICTVHVLPSREGRAKTWLHQRVEWLALRWFCDRVLTVSEETRQHYIAESGIPAHKILTLYNGIDLSPYTRLELDLARVAVREEFHLPPDSLLLATVAVLRPQKGIEYMIRALPDVAAAHPNARYLIVGDGSHREALEAEAKKTGMAERIVFAGMRRDTSRLLAASDVFVLPTLTEALPTVLAEAMASSLPIVASAVGGVPEMVTDGENGLLVPPAQPAALSRACTALLNDAELRQRMGGRGWQIVNEKFNVAAQVRELEEIYLDELNRHAK